MKHMKTLYREIRPAKKPKRKLPEGVTMMEHLTSIGKIKTKKKAAASRANGKLGGRPRKQDT